MYIVNMHVEDDDIVSELLEYDSTGVMTISVFISLNTMDADRRRKIYQMLDVARMLSKPSVDE